MYELVASTAHLQTREAISRTIADQLQQTYLARFVQVNVYEAGSLPPLVMTAAAEPPVSMGQKPDRVYPILTGPKLAGDISIWKGPIPLPSENDRMVQSFLRQISLALDRAQAVKAA